MSAKRLIIADGQNLTKKSLKKTLIEKGFKVVGEASTGKGVIELNQNLKADLIFIDLNMPDISGFEAAKGISLTNPTPIILTEKNNHKFKESAKITGVMAYLVRPFNKKELIPNIEIAISRFKEHEALLRDNADLKEQLKARKIIEKAKGILMRKYSVNEKEAFRKIQKASMNKHVTMKEIAESILMASDLENQSL